MNKRFFVLRTSLLFGFMLLAEHVLASVAPTQDVYAGDEGDVTQLLNPLPGCRPSALEIPWRTLDGLLTERPPRGPVELNLGRT